MKFKNLKITAIVLAVLMVAGATTALAAESLPAFADFRNNRGAAESTDMKIVDADGSETAVNNGRLMRPAGKFRINDDGSVNEIRDDYVDSLYDSLGIPQSPFAPDISSREDAERTVASFGTLEEANAFANPDIAPSTYTDDELAQIIAEIESGERPISGRINEDGIFELYNLPEDSGIARRSVMAGRSLADAELTVTFTLADGTEVFSGPGVYLGE